MSQDDEPIESWRQPRALASLERFLGSWRFPLVALVILSSFTLLLFALVLVPHAESGLGAFAAEFRQWCFGQDPATGELEWGYVAMTVGSPLLLGGLLVAFWWQPLRELATTRPEAILRSAIAALAITGAAGTGMLLFTTASGKGPLPFPAEGLRTAIPAADFTLTNQDGRAVRLSDLRGHVVLVTAVYTTCGQTCPMIFAQLERATAGLTAEERAQLLTLAITLDPERDTVSRVAEIAKARGFTAPARQFLTGEPTAVSRVLDAYGFERRRDEKTGIIEHANLFILVDRRGLVAYRFSLGERQERWLQAASRLLVAEQPAT
jgi:protein SCO1/2